MLGEVRLWPNCYRNDHRCGCGQVKTACPFWSAVVEGLPNQIASEAAFERTLQRRTLFILMLPRRVADWMYPGLQSEVQSFYSHLAKIDGLSTVIDSSKNPAYGLILDRAPQMDMTIIHIVRHPLGVVYSWKRQRQRNQEAALYRVRKPLLLASVEWTLSNIFAEVMKWRSCSRAITVHYEDLGSLKMNELLQNLKSDAGSTVPSSAKNHVMSGNPGGAAQQNEFTEDTEWRTGLSLIEKAAYGIITLPIFFIYKFKK